MYDHRNIEILKGKTITKVQGLEKYSDAVYFYTAEGQVYKMYHYQDCCESVSIEDFNLMGELRGEVLNAYESTEEATAENTGYEYMESGTWTFYRISTMSGDLFLRWLGTSNGYYGEGVDFELVDGTDEKSED